MGTTTETRSYPACSIDELKRHYNDTLSEMINEHGSGSYSGNWSTCEGLQVTDKVFSNSNAAGDYLNRVLEKRGSVLAVKVGDFSNVFPKTKQDQTLVEKAKQLSNELFEFDRNILLRAQSAKSKTKKCTHCESSINVKKLVAPSLKEMRDPGQFSGSGVVRHCGNYLMVNYCGLTDCPVCNKNLLRTDTDIKNKESLRKRVQEAEQKVNDAKKQFTEKTKTLPKAYWLVSGECSS